MTNPQDVSQANARARVRERLAPFPNIRALAVERMDDVYSTLATLLDTESTATETLGSLFRLIEDTLTHYMQEVTAAHAENAAQQNQVQNLQNQVQNLQNQAQNLQTLNTALQVNQLNVNSNRAPHRRITHDPDKFNGEGKDVAKRQETYLTWKDGLLRCFSVDTLIFDTDFMRLQHMASLLTGDAATLHRDRFATITLNPTLPATWHWKTSFDAFKSLDEQYATLDLSRQAAIDFDNLRMGNRPYQNFKADFVRHAQLSGKTPVQMVEALKLKVSTELFNEASHVRNKPASNDFEAWSSLFHDIYQDQQEAKHYSKVREGRTVTNGTQHLATVQTPTQTDGGDPMVLDAVRQITRDQCAYCKEKGHWKDDCQKRKAAMAMYSNLPGNQQRQVRGQPAFDRGHSTYPRGNFGGRGRGRGNAPPGQYQVPYQNNPYPAYQQPTPAQWPQTWQYPSQLRAMEHGYAETESELSTSTLNKTSDTLSFTPPISAPNPQQPGNV